VWSAAGKEEHPVTQHPDSISSASATDRSAHQVLRNIKTLQYESYYRATVLQFVVDLLANSESDRNYDMRSIPLRYDYDTTTTKNYHVYFLLASNRVEWKQTRTIRRGRIVVVSQSIERIS